MSLFITFEGCEGSGKSFQSNVLYKLLSRENITCILTREPGGTPFGEEVTKCLKWQNTAITPIAELLMFNASRSHLMETVIKPALKDGKVVICDRFTDSTLVYQGYGRKLDFETIEKVNDIATGGLKPDLTILMDILPGIGLARKRYQKRDRFEKEGLAFHNRVRRGYRMLAEKEPGRWFIVDASKSKEEIARLIWERIRQLIAERPGEITYQIVNEDEITEGEGPEITNQKTDEAISKIADERIEEKSGEIDSERAEQ